VAFALGCLVASPVVIYQIWAFLSPALYERERRLIVPALAVVSCCSSPGDRMLPVAPARGAQGVDRLPAQ